MTTFKRGIPANCQACRYNFVSSYSALIEAGNTVRNSIESCPRCGAAVLFEGGDTIIIDGIGRLLPTGRRATRSNIDTPKPLTKSAFVSTGFDSPLSVVWQIWSTPNGNVYLRCREFPLWKLSIHASGDDNIGYTDEAWYGKLDKVFPGNTGRHMYQAHRYAPFVGHATRVIRCITTGDFNGVPFGAANPLKEKYRRQLRLLRPVRQAYSVFDVAFTAGHPFDYVETRHPEGTIAVLQARDGEFVSLFDGHIAPFKPGDENFHTSTRLEKPLPVPFYGTTSLTFGVSPINTFIVKVHHAFRDA